MAGSTLPHLPGASTPAAKNMEGGACNLAYRQLPLQRKARGSAASPSACAPALHHSAAPYLTCLITAPRPAALHYHTSAHWPTCSVSVAA